MIKTALPFLFLLAISLASPSVRAGFEEDLAATGKTDNIQALRELHTSAEAGDADAQLNLGGLFFKGQEVAQDYAEAEKWFRIAALKGHPQAQFNLGMMYDTGLGVAVDHAEAAKWYRLAADQGLAIAQLNLGVAYATGQGILQNEPEAVKWLLLAADQGEAQAQFNLAVMYANGQGVAQNLPESYRWARLAAAQGHETAPGLVADLSRMMTPAQMAAANAVPGKTAEKAAAAVKPPAATGSGDVYLQLGAFRSQKEAARFMGKMRARLGPVGKPFSLFTENGWVRVHVGPYANWNEAHQKANSLKAKLGFEPLLKQH